MSLRNPAPRVDVRDIPKDEEKGKDEDPLPRFSSDPSLNKIQLVFRHIGDPETSHWANRLAASITRKPTDIFPAGHFCHVELCMEQSRGVWYRFSINKKTGTRDDKGNITYQKGRVHGLEVLYDEQRDDEEHNELKHYTNCILMVPREKQKKAWEFFNTQIGAPFNMFAYVANVFWMYSLWPFAFGTTKFEEWMLERKRKWFCSELVMTALQAMGIEEFYRKDGKMIKPSESSPNMIFRCCPKMSRSAGFKRNPHT